MVKGITKYTPQVLQIGPNYKKRKGGISSLLQLYSKNIPDFHFFPSAYFQNTILNFLGLPFVCFTFVFKLIYFNSSIKIIHIHGASNGSFYRKYVFFLIAKFLFQKKVIFHLHGGKFHLFYRDSPLLIQKRIRHLIENVDGVIVLSAEWKKIIENTFFQKKIFILKNMVAQQPPQEINTEIPIKFIFTGKISEEKGIFDLLTAIKNNYNSFEGKLEIWICGNGEVDKFLEEINKYNLTNIIKYFGWVSGKQKEKLMREAQVMLLPSYHEGLPISLLEAMSFSMPLIASEVGGIPLILKKNINGVLITPGNIEELAEALKVYLENPKKINLQGKSSYEIVQNFFPEQVLPQLEAIYKKIITE